MDLVFDYKYIQDFYSTIFPKYTCNTNVKSFSCLKIFIYNYYFLTKSYRTLSWQSFKLLSPFTQFFQMFQNPSSPAWERTNFNFAVKALICLARIQVWRIFFCDFKVLILKKNEKAAFQYFESFKYQLTLFIRYIKAFNINPINNAFKAVKK